MNIINYSLDVGPITEIIINEILNNFGEVPHDICIGATERLGLLEFLLITLLDTHYSHDGSDILNKSDNGVSIYEHNLHENADEYIQYDMGYYDYSVELLHQHMIPKISEGMAKRHQELRRYLNGCMMAVPYINVFNIQLVSKKVVIMQVKGINNTTDYEPNPYGNTSGR